MAFRVIYTRSGESLLPIPYLVWILEPESSNAESTDPPCWLCSAGYVYLDVYLYLYLHLYPYLHIYIYIHIRVQHRYIHVDLHIYVSIPIPVPTPPNVAPLRALWSLLDGIWGLLKGSLGVLAKSPDYILASGESPRRWPGTPWRPRARCRTLSRQRGGRPTPGIP